MSKEEVKKALVKELKFVLPPELGEKTINYFADNILAKLPDNYFEVIAKGRVRLFRVISQNEKEYVQDFYLDTFKNFNIDLDCLLTKKQAIKLENKNIEIAIRVIPDIKDESRGK